MSASNTVTKNDLKAILEELSLGAGVRFSLNTITLPYTPQKNGFIIALLRANSTDRAYVTYSNTYPTIVDGYNKAQGYINGVIFAVAGTQVSEVATSNVNDKLYYFVSLA